MTNLSPAAQAVLDAANYVYDRAGTTGHGLAAALRAAAEELQYRLFLPGTDPMVVDAKALFNLANELEGGND
jgi:hypothetical protein